MTLGLASVRIGINGFGRMGRLVVRALQHHEGLDVVHVNEIAGDVETAAHLMTFDSVHGRWDREATVEGGRLVLHDATAAYTNAEVPGQIPWADSGVDIVLECTGSFRDRPSLQKHLDAGAEVVIVAAPVSDPSVLNIVMGCNDNLYDPARHPIVTAASCTTNCVAPVVKVLHESFGIERGMITTLHDVTNTQVVVDAPTRDLRRSRSALNSLIPTSTGSATAITMIYPELHGRLDGIAVRVPLLNASLADCVFTLGRPVSTADLNGVFETASAGSLAGVLGFENRPLVSADFVNERRSAVIDGPSTMVVDETMVKVLAWYDNEYGYVHRMAELAAMVADRRKRS